MIDQATLDREFEGVMKRAEARVSGVCEVLNQLRMTIEIETVIALLMVASYGYRTLQRKAPLAMIKAYTGVDGANVSFTDIARMVDDSVIMVPKAKGDA